MNSSELQITLILTVYKPPHFIDHDFEWDSDMCRLRKGHKYY